MAGCGTIPDNAINRAKGAAVVAAFKIRFPGARYAGSCCCRQVRGSAAGNSTAWSTHSVCGAVDFFPGPGATVPAMMAYARSLPGITEVIYDQSPGDVHVQYVPNLTHTPECAGGSNDPQASGGGSTVPTDALWTLLGKAGFSDTIRVPGEPNHLTARRMAYAIAKAESGGNLAPGGNLFQITGGGPRTALANARAAAVLSGLGTVWVAWCTAFGGPRVPNPRHPGVFSKDNCGHQAPNYLRTVSGIAPAYVAHIPGPNIASQAGSTPGAPSGFSSTGGSFTVVNKFLPANCAEATSLKGKSGLPVFAQMAPGTKITVNADISAAAKAGFCSIPILGSVPCAVASVLAKLPVYLKIAAGGVVLVLGVGFLIAGATGAAPPPLIQRVSGAPGVRRLAEPIYAGRERRRAIGAERVTQRQRTARSEAESRVSAEPVTGRVRVQGRRSYRATLATREQRQAGEASERATTRRERLPSGRSTPGLGARRGPRVRVAERVR